VPRPTAKPPARRHTERRRGSAFQPRSPEDRRAETIWIYGIHPVLAALKNPRRTIRRLLATPNAAQRLQAAGATLAPAPETVTPRDLDRLLGDEAVHQGVAVEAAPLPAVGIDALADAHLVVVLDQITDPHNVGAIFRSAAAFGADAVVTTGRHAPLETAVLAKAASGALDVVARVEVPNLARALAELGEIGFTRIGLDSAASADLEDALTGDRLALVLGAEGKGLRQLTRETCDTLARLAMPGEIVSLNVSNAAALALYVARRRLG
jgi:23S rRNA (guanosine2251-2'-O)-methyltransferase